MLPYYYFTTRIMLKNILLPIFLIIIFLCLTSVKTALADAIQNNILQSQIQLDDYQEDENDLFDISNKDFKRFLVHHFLSNNFNKARLRNSVIFDNFDNRVFGRERLASNIQLHNLWKGNGLLTWNSNINQEAINRWLFNLHEKNNFNFTNNIELQVPVGKYQINYRHQNQNYQYYQTEANKLNFKQGQVATNRFSLNYALFSSANYKSFIRTSIRFRSATIRRDDQEEISKSLNSTIYGIGFSQLISSKNQELFIKPTYYSGGKGFGARNDSKYSDLPNNNQFDLFDLHLSYTQKLNNDYAQKIVFNSQVATRSLYSNEQISIGGVSSVRGFESDSISGDSGFFINYELSSKLGKLYLLNNCKICQNIENTFFFDYGEVYDLLEKAQENRYVSSLAGTGFAWQFNHKLAKVLTGSLVDSQQEVRWQYSVAMPIKKASLLVRKNNSLVFYLRLALDL